MGHRCLKDAEQHCARLIQRRQVCQPCKITRGQQLAAGCVPSDRAILIESFTDELGQRQMVVHSSFGIRVNETWAMALARVGYCLWQLHLRYDPGDPTYYQ